MMDWKQAYEGAINGMCGYMNDTSEAQMWADGRVCLIQHDMAAQLDLARIARLSQTIPLDSHSVTQAAWKDWMTGRTDWSRETK